MIYHKPFDLDIMDFLNGPEYGANEIHITDDFDCSYIELLVNRHGNYTTGHFEPVDNIKIPSIIDHSLHYCKTIDGVTLLNNSLETVGFYSGHVLSLAESLRGLRLGMEIVIVGCLLHGTNPGWDGEHTMYTVSGELTHRRAWENYRRFPERFNLQIQTQLNRI